MDVKEILERLKHAGEETAKSAQEHLDRGADPDDVARALAHMFDGLPDGVKVAHIGTLGKQLDEGEKLRALEELGKRADPETLREALARLQSLFAKPNGPEDSSGSATPN